MDALPTMNALPHNERASISALPSQPRVVCVTTPMKPIIPWIVAGLLAMPALAETPAQSAAKQSEAAFQQGVAAEKAGDLAGAQEGYSKALKLSPGNANARYSLGQ